jgi:hypothetical protein
MSYRYVRPIADIRAAVEEHKSRRRVASANYRKNNEQKIRARKAVYIEVRAGRLRPERCLICGETDTEAHHHDYGKPLEVYWLCREHHRSVENKGFYTVHLDTNYTQSCNV